MKRKRIGRSGQQSSYVPVLDSCDIAADGRQWRILAHLAINGVGRKGSLKKIKTSDVDIANSAVRCMESKTKNYRYTPVHPKSMIEIIGYYNALPPGQVMLFTSKFHRLTWKRICAAAGVPFVTFHHLRTWTDSQLKIKGVSEQGNRI